MERGALWATVHGSKESDTFEPTHTYTHIILIQEKAEVREMVTVQDGAR